MHDKGGLWGCSIKAGELLQEAQRYFNENINENAKNISVQELFEKINIEHYIGFGNVSTSTKILILEKFVKLYLTAISFGFAKKRSEEHLASKKYKSKKSFRADLKRQHEQ